MKYKILALAVIAVILVVPLLMQGYEAPRNRYHQHLEAALKAPCTDHGGDTFCTHLPLMNIVTDSPMPDPYCRDGKGNIIRLPNGTSRLNNETVSATVEFFDSADKNNHLTDTPLLREAAMIRVRGNSSRGFDKKGYLLNFKDETLVNNKDVSFAGFAAESDWVLNGPFLDKTLIRNYMCYNLAGEIMDYSPNVIFCEVFLNGQYEGLYLLLEKIGRGSDGRLDLTKTDPKRAETSYILRLDRGAEDELHRLYPFSYYSGINWSNAQGARSLEIVYPGAYLTPQQAKYIEDDVSRFEKALYSSDIENKKHGYPACLDTASFVDYYLLNEFTMNYDAMSFSTYFYRDLRGKIGTVVWDFNSAWDLYQEPLLEKQGFSLQNEFWYVPLFKSEDFVDQVIRRYHHLRRGVLSDDYLLDYIDDTTAYLGDAIRRNYEVWGYTFLPAYDMLEDPARNPRTYEQAIAQLKNCIVERGAYMDEHIENLHAYSHESVNKRFFLGAED